MRVRLLLPLALLLVTGLNAVPAQSPAPARIPVIFDTDIGDDIDDSYALVELLKSHQLDIKLITTTYGKSEYRARLIGKYLTLAGRTDIPIGLGPELNSPTEKEENMAKWISDFSLSAYKGRIEKDGAQAIVDTINRSPVPVTVIAVGPLSTLGAALKKDPGIAAKTHLVGMDGSVFKGYSGSPKPGIEYNVYSDIPDAKQVFSAPWKSIVITPLDTCGIVSIDGEFFQKFHASQDPLVQGLLASHMIHNNLPDTANLTNSGTCFDAVAVYLADPMNRAKFQIDKMKIAITDNGATVVSADGTDMLVATAWSDKEGFILDLGSLILSQP